MIFWRSLSNQYRVSSITIFFFFFPSFFLCVKFVSIQCRFLFYFIWPRDLASPFPSMYRHQLHQCNERCWQYHQRESCLWSNSNQKSSKCAQTHQNLATWECFLPICIYVYKMEVLNKSCSFVYRSSTLTIYLLFYHCQFVNYNNGIGFKKAGILWNTKWSNGRENSGFIFHIKVYEISRKCVVLSCPKHREDLIVTPVFFFHCFLIQHKDLKKNR